MSPSAISKIFFSHLPPFLALRRADTNSARPQPSSRVAVPAAAVGAASIQQSVDVPHLFF